MTVHRSFHLDDDYHVVVRHSDRFGWYVKLEHGPSKTQWHWRPTRAGAIRAGQRRKAKLQRFHANNDAGERVE